MGTAVGEAGKWGCSGLLRGSGTQSWLSRLRRTLQTLPLYVPAEEDLGLQGLLDSLDRGFHRLLHLYQGRKQQWEQLGRGDPSGECLAPCSVLMLVPVLHLALCPVHVPVFLSCAPSLCSIPVLCPHTLS